MKEVLRRGGPWQDFGSPDISELIFWGFRRYREYIFQCSYESLQTVDRTDTLGGLSHQVCSLQFHSFSIGCK